MAFEQESRTALSNESSDRDVIEGMPLFFGPGIFGVIHRPAGPGLPGWVICSPFGKERVNSHRLGFEWARRLAAAGHWVLRFDYRGTGDSVGSFEDFTVHDYIEDIGCARAELESVSGMRFRGVLGLRLGASLAAMYVASVDGDLDLALWEPIIDGEKYRKSLLRTAMANEMVNSSGPSRSRNDLRRQLAAGESVSVDGYALTNPMYESLAAVDLAALGRPTSGRVLIVQIKTRRSQPIPSALFKLAESYSAGGETRLEAVEEPPVWMRTRSYRWQLTDLFGKTLGWMTDRQQIPCRTGAPVKFDAGRIQNSKSVERPVEFEVGGEKVRGILHEPFQPSDLAPNIVMIAAGEACRTAFFYRQLAEDLATRGWNVLRFDPRGIGDSDGNLNCPLLTEVFTKVENGMLVPDTLAAMEFMDNECGSRGSVLIGLCGGAITSILTAQTDERVVGIAPLELPMRLTPRTESRQQSTLSRQIPWDESLSRHRGVFFLLKARRVYHLFKSFRRLVGLSLASIIYQRSGHVPGERGWYREKIGDDASCDVLAALEKTLDRKIPVFCIFADTEQPGLFEMVLPGLHAGRTEVEKFLAYRVIRDADHNFTMPGFSEELSKTLVTWLDDPNVPWG